MKNAPFLGAAAILAAGLALCGGLTGYGFFQGRAVDRYVTVKGSAERDVLADVALWPLRFVSTDNDLARAQAKIEQSKAKVIAFFDRHGISAPQVEVQRLEVTDLLANPYRSGTTESRYIIAQTLMAKSTDAAVIQQASQAVSELVADGVVLSSEGGPALGPTYLFTRLNELKPAMIAEATANARQAAEQFAKDSGSRVGRIRTANQGLFVILPRDKTSGAFEESQANKTVRVVSTIEYYLVD